MTLPRLFFFLIISLESPIIPDTLTMKEEPYGSPNFVGRGSKPDTVE